MDIRIDIFVRCVPEGYRIHGMRRWPCAPREGESIFVKGGKQPWPDQLCIIEAVHWFGDDEGKLDRVELYVKANKQSGNHISGA